MLSVLLFGIGTAYAIYGVQDDVPGQDVLIPMICGAQSSNFLNTLWAIFETKGGAKFPDSDVTVRGHYFVHNVLSVQKADKPVSWTPHDVVVNDCKTVIAAMDPTNRSDMLVEIDGIVYFAGYIRYVQEAAADSTPTNRFVTVAYMLDAPNGFAAGFNPPSIEDGLGPELGESSDAFAVSASDLYPRYNIVNNMDGTFNWWIILLGRNELNNGFIHMIRTLECNFCNEDELCASNHIPIPNELNIINVAHFLPSLHTKFPLSGFAYCTIQEVGDFPTLPITHVVLNGTVSPPDLFPVSVSNYYSLYAWSYQRATSESLTVTANWDSMNPFHRTYCLDVPAGTGGDGTFNFCNETLNGTINFGTSATF